MGRCIHKCTSATLLPRAITCRIKEGVHLSQNYILTLVLSNWHKTSGKHQTSETGLATSSIHTTHHGQRGSQLTAELPQLSSH